MHPTIRIPGPGGALWSFATAGGGATAFGAPSFEVDGRVASAKGARLRPLGPWKPLWEGLKERRYEAEIPGWPGLRLGLQLRSWKGGALRFRYQLSSDPPRSLTRTKGRDAVEYLAFKLPMEGRHSEVRLGEFQELVHSYVPSERPVLAAHFKAGMALSGPILASTHQGRGLLVAYEHGSTIPDAFIQYELSPSGSAAIRAVKGNTLHGQSLSKPFESPWFIALSLKGGMDELASAFRSFMLKGQSGHRQSREPHIFYNTWNYQERHKHWEGGRFLDPMKQGRILREIKAAGRLGIEYFVIDTGWYGKTGDWQVNLKRFPDGLKAVNALLKRQGMKLGLWFNPTVAALSSRTLAENIDCLRTLGGAAPKPAPIWETEKSRGLCLVSRYHEAFAAELIRLHRELGVTYFKWDAVDQYGCDDPNHLHGGPQNSPAERAESFSFLLPRYMAKVAELVGRACPDLIVDFDVTEKDRCFGLEFFAMGKQFCINNGPYNFNLDLSPKVQPMGINMFVAPGPARGWICRKALDFDRWLPSTLMLAHYLTDDPESSLELNLASMALGQNGLWGDLPRISRQGAAYIRQVIQRYKKVRHDMQAADPRRSGEIGASPEIHEKINPLSGRGGVVVFATQAGVYRHLTRTPPKGRPWHNGGVSIAKAPGGLAELSLDFKRPGAKMIFFGAG